MMRYRFTISHVPGKDLIVADMLSQALTSTPASADQQFHREGNAFINMVIQGLPASDQQLETIKTYITAARRSVPKDSQTDKHCEEL